MLLLIRRGKIEVVRTEEVAPGVGLVFVEVADEAEAGLGATRAL